MDRALTNITIRSVDDGQRVIEGIATTPRPDRVGDVVEPAGVEYALPLPLMLDHNPADVVGEIEWVQVTAAGIKFRARIRKVSQPGPVKDLCDKAWQLVKNGLRKSVSIGFRALEHAVLPGGGLRFLSWEWLELSLTAIPAQPDARITGFKALTTKRRDRVVKVATAEKLRVVHAAKGKGVKIKRARVVRLTADDMPSKATPGPMPVVRLTARDYARANSRVVKL